jgi:tRNA A-37 threonylcarbamoyl transferase component Bud32
MELDADPLGKLSESIADGESIDWDALRAAAPDDDVRRLLEHLRIVAGVAEVHRSQFAETVTASIAPRTDTTPQAAAAQSAARWGHLLLIRKIGEGAFGEVYEALDTWLDHPRALKLLKPEVANRSSAPQILHEARKLVRVRHPNVVMVHGADSHDGRVGFWMDLIEGQTLEQRVRDGRLSPGEAIYVGQELCRAVAAVHQANLLHRDIKAQNVMRASDGGRIILMDFGAGEFRDAPATSRPHGTPLYLAPELLTGGAATIQSDIYSLGVLLYYLVSGRFPVEGKSFPDMVLAHAQHRRQHLRDLRSDLPDGFVNVVERAIDPNPERRFQSAGQLHAALEERDPGGLSRQPIAEPVPISTPVPTPIPLPVLAPPAPSSYPSLSGILLGTLGVAAVILFLGIVACRTFEVALHVPPGFTAGPIKYLQVGTWGLLAFAMFWVLEAAAVAALMWIRLLFKSTIERFTAPIEARMGAVDAATLATLVAVLGLVWWAAITWWHSPLFSTLFALQSGTAASSQDPSLTDRSFREMYRSYGYHSAVLTFVLLFLAWRWWPRLERRAADRSFVRGMRWAPIAITILALVCAMAPRRFVWERFREVLYRNQPSFVIGTNAEELLLYTADTGRAAPRRVRMDSPDIAHTDTDQWQFIVPE